MRRRGDLQFTHDEDAASLEYGDPKRVHGFAANREGDIVANVTIDMPYAKILTSPTKNWSNMGRREVAEPSTDPDGQMKMPIYESPAKVSWALANKEGRAAAAPHKLLAALSEEHNVRPVADHTLSPEGSAMSRSAARRGLIQPHPLNKEMKATIPSLYPPNEHGEEQIHENLSAHEESDWLDEEHLRPVFSEAQMGRAHQRVFGSRKKQRTPEPEAEQMQLFHTEPKQMRLF